VVEGGFSYWGTPGKRIERRKKKKRFAKGEIRGKGVPGAKE